MHFICLSCSNKVLQATEMWVVSGSRSNLASTIDSPVVVFYICSIHYICPACSDKMTTAVAVFNVFSMGAIWPWFGFLEVIVTYLYMYISVSLCCTISTGNRLQKVYFRIVLKSRVKFVQLLKSNITIEMAPVTFRNGSRSNGLYATKVMLGILIYHI